MIRHRLALALVASALAVGAVACSSEDANDTPTDTGTSADIGGDASADTGADAASEDTTPSTDTTPGDVGGGPIAIEPDTVGPWSASFRQVEVTVGDRVLPVGIWAPSHEASASVGLDALVPADRSAQIAELVTAAPAGCPTTSLDVVVDGTIAEGSWPVVLYSHCHTCLGISGATTAHQLATWGFVVLAPDHVGNTLYDELEGEGIESFEAFLPVRAADLIGVLDALEAGEGDLAAVRDEVDPGMVATVGHSFGAVTAAYVAQEDDRIDATVALAAPIENPLIPGVDAASFDTPLVLVLAGEDNSIQEVGNLFLRQNFEATVGPTWLVEIADAGHWSVSDLCGMTETFLPGCGDATRQTNGEAFTYPDPSSIRAHAAAWVTALLGVELRQDDGARAWLASPTAIEGQTVQTRNVD